MRSIKAIVAGSAFILITLLFLGLLYIFIAVGYNKLAADFPVLKDIAGIFRYLVAIPVFIIVMFTGGYITASIAKKYTQIEILLHCLFVGLLTAGGTTYSTMEYSSLTVTGVVVIMLALAASSAGGFYWLRGNKNTKL